MKKNALALVVLLLGLSLVLTPAAFGGGAKGKNSKFGLSANAFRKIADEGFADFGGDSANSYSWGVGWFKNDLYVGTNRHHLWSLMLGLGASFGDLGGDLLAGLLPDPPLDPTFGSLALANDMAGQIWRYHDKIWTKVYQSPVYRFDGASYEVPGYGKVVIPEGYYPKAYGYRTIGTFKKYVYACGVGSWMPPMPYTTILRSRSGNPDTWEDVTGALATTTNVRGFVEWKGKLFIAASLEGPMPAIGGGSVVFASSDPGKKPWKEVSEVGFGNPQNVEIYYLTVFNNHLYASTVNYDTGFEVWKTDGTTDCSGKYVWTNVMKNGGGDTWNQFGMHMEPFGKYLYIGTAVGAGTVRKNGEMVGSRPFEVFRVDKYDNVELIVGSRMAYDPIEGGPSPRIPKSGWPAGFGNPFNVYVWKMGVFDGWLYLGTLDLCSMLLKAVEEDPSSLTTMLSTYVSTYPADDLNFTDDINSALKDGVLSNKLISSVAGKLYDRFGGGDIWKTKDGRTWIPVTLNGLGNPKNYGFRQIVPSGDDTLAIGTANPFTGKENGGCEAWLASKHRFKRYRNHHNCNRR